MKTKVFFLAASLVPFLASAQQKAEPVSKGTYMSNGVFITLLSVIILLAIMIAGMVEMVKASATHRARKEKEKPVEAQNKEGDGGKGSTIHSGFVLLILMSCLPLTSLAQEVAAAAPADKALPVEPPFDYWGLGAQMFFVMVSVIFVELVIFYVLYRTGIDLIKDGKEKAAKKAGIMESKIMKSITGNQTAEEEEAIMMDHEYDGIRELDNNLPLWWKYGFYFTIVVAVVYLFNYHVLDSGLSSKEEFEKEMAEGEAQVAEYKKNNAGGVDENNVTLLTDAAAIGAGKGIFMQNCAACHGANGEGLVGPNLTDDYWLHKGGVSDVFISIKYGWPDKGMKAWEQDLKPVEMQQLVSYIASLRGTNPANAKEAQGDLFVPDGAAPVAPVAADTAGADSVKAK